MKTKYRFLIALLIIYNFATAVKAEVLNGICDENISWSLDTETGILNISGTGIITSAPWRNYRNLITEIDIAEGIEVIKCEAFAGFVKLKQITIPKSIKAIWRNTFGNCPALEIVNIPDINAWVSINFDNEASNPMFGNPNAKMMLNGKEVTEITLSDTIRYITDYSLANTNIQKIVLPDSISRIGSSAFSNCTELKEVVIPQTEFGTFNDRFEIGSNAFYNCSSLKNFTFPRGMVFLNPNSFGQCTALENVHILGSLACLFGDYYCFYNCTNLKNVYIENLKSYASNNYGGGSCGIFQYAEHVYIEGKQIKDVVIPEGVKDLSAGIFGNCKTIKSVKLPSTIEHIGTSAFIGSSIESITIPTAKLQTIYERAFYGCDALKEVHIDDYMNWGNVKMRDRLSSPLTANGNVRMIVNGSEIAGNIVLYNANKYTFKNCKKITSVKFINSDRNGQAYVGEGAFSGCTGLMAIELPHVADADKNSYNIENNAFAGCSALQKVEIPTCAGLILGDSAFANCGNIDLSIDAVTVGGQPATIGSSTFFGCTGNAYINTNNNSNLINIIAGTAFQNILLGDSVKVIPSKLFNNYTTLYSIGLPVFLETIGSNAFDGCTGLRSISAPENVIIEDYAFANCTNLEHIDASKLKSVGANVIKNTALYNNAPAGGIYIGDWLVAYKNDEPVPQVHIHAGIKGIASRVFANNTLLNYIYIGEVRYINEEAFSGCSNLYDIQSDQENVEYIGESAFRGCNNLSASRLLINVKEIGDNAFDRCTSLPGIDCFNLEKLGKYAFRGCTSVQVINSLGSITEIPQFAFEKCSNLVRCEIPTTVKSIGTRAFRDCGNLKQITIPTNVENIENYAFENNIALDTIIIASHKVFIDYDAFKDCESIKAVYIVSDSVPSTSNSIQRRPFMTGSPRNPNPRGTLYVPLGCKDKYPENITMDFLEVVEMDMNEFRQTTEIDIPTNNSVSNNIRFDKGKLYINDTKCGETIWVYSIDGTLLKSVTSTSNEEVLTINKKTGILVIRVNKNVYKIQL